MNNTYLIVFMLILAYASFVSIFFAPIKFNIMPNGSKFIIEVIKISVLFLFFYIGVTIVKNNRFSSFIKVYSYSAFLIATFGIVFTLINVPIMDAVFFKIGDRLNGLMNDPNYFAILQIVALPYFFRNGNENKKQSLLAIIVIIFSIILSGSKTGLISLTLYLAIYYIEIKMLRPNTRTINHMILGIFKTSFIFVGLSLIIANINSMIEWMNVHFPVTNRITGLFTDFQNSVSSSESSRDAVWGAGLNLVKKSPFLGVGLSNYNTIGEKLYGESDVAHNSYVQLAAEWGIPLTMLFFTGVFILLFLATFKYQSLTSLSIQKDILVIFLIGSMGISLNNARFFWLILGAFIYSMNHLRRNDKSDWLYE